MSQALYRKWRPQRWDEVVGQEHVIQTLRNAVAAERVAHAHLFAGPRGTGKTTTARLLAKAVNCLDADRPARPCDACDHCLAVNQGRFLDLIEIDAASNTSVDDVRSLRDKINFAPNQGDYTIYIIDEVNMLSTAAFNALLKTLEEPPPHAMFVMATTEAHKIPATVLSRCQQHEFRRIPVADIVAQLKKLAASEQLTVEDDAYRLVARQATGSMRDAISLLDQLASTGADITLEMAQNVLGTAASQTILDLVDAIHTRQPDVGLNLVHQALDAGSDPRQFARQIVDYLRSLLLIRVGNVAHTEVTAEVRAQMARQAQLFTPAQLLRMIRIFTQAAMGARTVWQPGLPLELAVIESIEEPPAQMPAHASVAAPQQPTPAKQKTTPEPRLPAIPKPSAAPAAASAPATGQGPNLKTIEANWRTILTTARKYNRSTQALLNSCKVLEYKDRVLTLGFASDILKKQMERDEHSSVAHKAISEALGLQIRLRYVISSDNRQDIPPEVDSDGMVATAVRLGGKIVDSRDIPPRGEERKKQQ